MDTVTYDDNDYHFRVVKMTSQPYSENSYNGLNPYRKRFLDSLGKPPLSSGRGFGIFGGPSNESFGEMMGTLAWNKRVGAYN